MALFTSEPKVRTVYEHLINQGIHSHQLQPDSVWSLFPQVIDKYHDNCCQQSFNLFH